MNASLLSSAGWPRWLLVALLSALMWPPGAAGQSAPRDFGDAPDPYPTKLQHNGAWHINNGPRLGERVDLEEDGQPDANALGDDLAPDPQADDEDGVTFLTPLIPGQVARVQVVVLGDFDRAFLFAWLDFGRDGSWAEADDYIIRAVQASRGTNIFEFTVPTAAKEGHTFARFRVAAQGQLGYLNGAETGEVEDYLVTIGQVEYDFGDAPEPYPTLLRDNGARHIPGGPRLGWELDTESDGQPSNEAVGDDKNPPDGRDDEDGVTFLDPLTPGRQVNVMVVASGNFDRAMLNAWVDFGLDGSWAEQTDHIIRDVAVNPGTNVLTFTVPENAKMGVTYARFRINLTGKISFVGEVVGGEVEDYEVNIAEPYDYGDAPAPYPTLRRDNGARHVYNRSISLGARVDEEADGQPTGAADGDDVNPPGLPSDEDGVIFTSALVQGRTATVQVTASTRGQLYAWVDFNRNGSWADEGERIFNGIILSPGANTLTFDVPPNAATGRTFTRWRFTVQGTGLDFVGEAPDGEVEDHLASIITDRERCDLGCEGRDFWLAFPGNYAPDPDNPTRPTLYILGAPGITGTVTIPALGYATNFAIPASLTATVILPREADLGNLNNLVTNRGVRITASGDVRVTAFNRARYTTDSYQALNTSVLGTEYYVLAYGNQHTGVPFLNGSQFAVLAAHSNTVVTITPSVTVGSRVAGVPFNLVLQPGDVFQLRATNDAPADLTGSHIKADKPIAVFAGHQCANVPTNTVWFCDYLVEQLLPVNTWGNEFYLLPLATRTGGDFIRILSAQDGTTLNINGLNFGPLNRGQFLQRRLTAATRIQSSQPVLVAQYATSSDYDDNPNADPFMTQVAATRHFTTGYLVTAPTNGFATNYLQLIVPVAATGSVLLDGVAVPAGAFSTIAGSAYAGANLQVSPGRHIVVAGAPFGVTVYGWAAYESYGHPGCFHFGDVLEPAVTTSSFTYTAAVGSTPNNPGTASVPNIAGTAQVADNCSPQLPPPTQSIAPGTMLTPGLYTVNVAQADYNGNIGVVTVNFTVIDPSPVQIQCPPDMVVNCNTNDGAVVFFNVHAFTTYETNVAVVSTPPSGSVFPVGTTVVTNVATSLATNTAVCTFTVTVTCEKKVTAQVGRTGLLLSWPQNAALEYSVNPTGPWTVVATSTNQFLSPMSGPRGFYRVRYESPP